MENSPKPRINGSMIAKHIGHYVCVVGKNLGIGAGGGSMTLETSDKQKITANFPRPVMDPIDPYVEVLGRVEQDCSISVERIANFGAEFDLNAYDEVIKLAANFPQLFPSPLK